jgi:hypothetical protein
VRRKSGGQPAALHKKLRFDWDWSRDGVLVFHWEYGFHYVFQFVGALRVVGIVVDGGLEGPAMLGADALQLFLQADGNSLGVERIGFGQNQAKNFRREPIDGIGGAQLAGHGFGSVAEGGGAVGAGCGSGEFGLDQQEGEIFLHGHRTAIFHGEAIPEMVDVRHGVQQVGASLQAEFDIAFELFENLLFELVDGALAFEQVADEEKRERAETEEGDAQGPLVGDVGVDENERVHKDRQAAGQHKDKDGGHDGELKLAALETIEFLPIDSCHACFHLAN